jgi:hypothetical protein
VSDNGTYHPSAGFTPSASGGYWWYASYGGDSGNNPSASACGASMPETTVARVSTSLSLTVPSVGAAGTAISSVAALSGGLAPGGTVTFKVFGPQASAPSDCSGGTTVGTASVSGSGNYRSAQFIPSAAGNYWWYASYGGDSNNNPTSSPCGASMAETVAGPGNGGGGNGTGGEGSAHLGAASVTGTTVTEPLSCSGSGSCAVTLTLSVTETISHGRVIAVTASHSSRRVIIARRSVHVAAGGHVRVRLPLNAKGRALLKHHSPLHALLGLSVGGRTGASTQVTIRRPRHRR